MNLNFTTIDDQWILSSRTIDKLRTDRRRQFCNSDLPDDQSKGNKWITSRSD
jgi:hypothetical protein